MSKFTKKELIEIFDSIYKRFKDEGIDDLYQKVEYLFKQHFRRNLYSHEDNYLRQYIRKLRDLKSWKKLNGK